MAIVDANGNPIKTRELAEPQTVKSTYLKSQWSNVNAAAGLSPAKLSQLFSFATHGNLRAQAELFESMLERDAHLYAEMEKRKSAPLTLNFTVEPPRNATAVEKANAAYADELLHDLPDFEDIVKSLLDGIGHGFAALEITWRRELNEWLPSFQPQPQEFFVLSEDKHRINLSNGTTYGEELRPFGWVMHTHGLAKTGYLGRMALFRVLAWPFLYKIYGLGDFAEFLEIYGLPIIVGKYGNGASPEQQKSLLSAVNSLGHDARAIMPQDMLLEIQSITGGGTAQHMTIVDWADKAQSKAILGGTLTSQADGKTSTNALGSVHNDVRDEIRNSDCKQIAGTITRDIIFPILMLNRGGVDSPRRCPRLVFDTGEGEDLALYAEALPKLTSIGMQIPTRYVHDKLKIPLPDGNEPVLTTATSNPPAMSLDANLPPNTPPKKAALSLPVATDIDPTPGDNYTQQLAVETAPVLNNWLENIGALVQKADNLAQLQTNLESHYGHLDSTELVNIMTLAFAAADLSGRYDVLNEGK